MFCRNLLDSTVEISSSTHVNMARILIGVLYLIMMNVTIIWIIKQKRMAFRGDNLAVESVIFPLFLNIMWLLALSDCYIGLLIIFLPLNLNEDISNTQFILYPIGYIIQHAILEGIAFLLLQKGCGYYGSMKAGQYTLLWSVFTTIAMYLRFAQIPLVSNLVYLTWCFLLVIFYLLIWILPSKYLYRRTAVIPYAKFWCLYRLVMFFFLIIVSLRSVTSDLVESIGYCGYDFIYLLFYPLIHPLVLYRTLLNDSRWWQGIAFHLNDTASNSDHKGTMRAPLLGVDLSQHSAQILARVVDNMGGKQTATLLNFAEIHLEKSKMLGHGSFSKVYRGSYRSTPCAIKLIFTDDLTEDVILRAEAEATLLSSVKSPNIVNIIGVSVLPPSVCIVLELCAYGSLSDVIRGDLGAHSKAPMSLSLIDRLYLALGCARGVAALHSLGKDVVHRDIKSYNFLVDGQLNAKLADLELGSDSRIEQAEDESPFQKDFLANWIPPEALRGEAYTQASDVYSLALVLWEIISGQIPFHDTMAVPPPALPASASTALFSTITKNFSFQSLTGYDSAATGGGTHASGNYGHSRQSIDSNTNGNNRKQPNSSSRISTRQQVLSGSRPEIPSCPPEYAEIIRLGWSLDRYHRPSAADVVTVLEKIISRYFPSNLNIIEESSEMYELVDAFLLTEVGKDYLSDMKNFRNEEDQDKEDKDSSLRISQTLSRFTRSITTKQLPSFPRFRANTEQQQPKYLLSPLRTHFDDTRTSSISIGLSASALASMGIGTGTGLGTGIGAHGESTSCEDEFQDDAHLLLDDEQRKSYVSLSHTSLSSSSSSLSLSSLYKAVSESVVWSIVNGLGSEPVMILSGQSPHFILKCSVDWHALLGYSAEEVFGKCLEHFIPPDSLLANPLLNQLHSQPHSQSQSRDSDLMNRNQPHRNSNHGTDALHGMMTTYDALTSFYSQLQSHSHSHSHLVLKLQTADQQVVPFSIHALPLFKRQERRLATDPLPHNARGQMISEQLKKAFMSDSSPTLGEIPSDGNGNGTQAQSQSLQFDDLSSANLKTVAFYVVYMNHLTYDYDEQQQDQQQREEKERTNSYVDRVLSIASSSFSLNQRGKSWMNTNGNGNENKTMTAADANHYPSPPSLPSVDPTESEEEKWGGFLL